RVLPEGWRKRLVEAGARMIPRPPRSRRRRGRLRLCHSGLIAAVAALALLISMTQLLGLFRFRGPWLNPLAELYVWASPLRSVNGYGLFAAMTTSRPEIIVQGSNDGQNWLEYEFKWKPGDLRHPP